MGYQLRAVPMRISKVKGQGLDADKGKRRYTVGVMELENTWGCQAPPSLAGAGKAAGQEG